MNPDWAQSVDGHLTGIPGNEGCLFKPQSGSFFVASMFQSGEVVKY